MYISIWISGGGRGWGVGFCRSSCNERNVFGMVFGTPRIPPKPLTLNMHHPERTLAISHGCPLSTLRGFRAIWAIILLLCSGPGDEPRQFPNIVLIGLIGLQMVPRRSHHRSLLDRFLHLPVLHPNRIQ